MLALVEYLWFALICSHPLARSRHLSNRLDRANLWDVSVFLSIAAKCIRDAQAEKIRFKMIRNIIIILFVANALCITIGDNTMSEWTNSQMFTQDWYDQSRITILTFDKGVCHGTPNTFTLGTIANLTRRKHFTFTSIQIPPQIILGILVHLQRIIQTPKRLLCLSLQTMPFVSLLQIHPH